MLRNRCGNDLRIFERQRMTGVVNNLAAAMGHNVGESMGQFDILLVEVSREREQWCLQPGERIPHRRHCTRSCTPKRLR